MSETEQGREQENEQARGPEPQQESAGADGAASDSPSFGQAAGVLGEALGQAMRVAIRRGRSEVGRAATTGRHRLQVRQLKTDRDAMLRKIGLEVLRLVEANEIRHPGLLRSAQRVAELDSELAELALRRAGGGDPQGEGDDAPES